MLQVGVTAMSEARMDEVLKEIMAERKQMKSLPILASRFSVIATPEHITDDEGNYVPPNIHRVSPYFGKEQDALDWIENHPYEGYNLSVRVQYLREFTEQRWSSF
jgi:hypothetical protein